MATKNSGSGTRLSRPKPFTKKIIEEVPDENPALYVLERNGKPVYAGVAKRGRVQERLQEHLDQDDVPGATRVRVRPMPTIADAKAAEEQFIRREKPKCNEQHNPEK